VVLLYQTYGPHAYTTDKLTGRLLETRKILKIRRLMKLKCCNKLKHEIFELLVPVNLIKNQNYDISIISGDIAMGIYGYPHGTLCILLYRQQET
jgi:hypothetical protein